MAQIGDFVATYTRRLWLKCSLFIVGFVSGLSLLAQVGYDLPRGKVVDTVKCKVAPDQSYAVYLPSAYDDSRNWPIVYFFEPAARGVLPVQRYHRLAEEYGFILVGSNNARNGPLRLGEEAYAALRVDTKRRFRLDEDAIITSGFSGGGRCAQYLAANNREVDGVIAVAGPKNHYTVAFPPEGHALKYVGIVGNKDFNYREHRLWDRQLQQRRITNFLIIYEAAHQWPPASEFRKTMAWMKVALGQASTDHYVGTRLKEVDSLMKIDSWEAERQLAEIRRNYPGYDEQVEVRSLELAANKTLKKIKKADERDLLFEEREQIKLNTALNESEKFIINDRKDSTIYTQSWWKKEITALQKKASGAGRRAYLNERLLNHLAAFLYGLGQKAEQLNRLDLGLFVNDLNLMIYPEAVWFKWQRAMLYARSGDRHSAEKQLAEAQRMDPLQLKEILVQSRWESLRREYPFLFP